MWNNIYVYNIWRGIFKIIDGVKRALEIKEEIIEFLKNNLSKVGRPPGLAVIVVGEDPNSHLYINIKEKKCKELGFHSEKYILSDHIKEEELLHIIQKLNKDDNIDGILVQLPLPKHLNKLNIFNSIDPLKDVDGFSFFNLGALYYKDYGTALLPCTPLGILDLIKNSEITLEGKEIVIVGRSAIVGKPLSILLLNENATVTLAHSKSTNLVKIIKKADILISAVGKPKLIRKYMIKEGAAVIDVGISKVENKLVGDVDFENVIKKASYITPVPGGVGPMTIAMLMQNTLKSYKMKNDL